VAEISPQSFSWSVPLMKFVGIYHNLVLRYCRGLGWSVYDLAESDLYLFRDIFWCDASWRPSRTIVINSQCSDTPESLYQS
jgi:hypothetical protein